ncbi:MULTISPECIES: hypothetical protein [Methylophaga]|uniref:Uncharacterized protein n=1 Tax=Methylophaga muralis TaxID=291169 RepID=A0A1E3GQD0_9GAMM|nr:MULTISPECIES: hypothetical protein [Methylophaga]ODN66145.1 hypothetical protein A9E74_02094 [Methylophaga muralis]THK42179.1 hypothetical protein E8Q33_05200 [Methylophaga sp. SB9B]
MQNTTKSVYTLFNWNILILPSDEEIFVGLCNRPETVPPFAPPDAADDLLPFILQNSSAIKEFNDKTGVGFDSDGSRYVLLGNASDPTGMIRFSVGQMMKPDEIRWKYEFID